MERSTPPAVGMPRDDPGPRSPQEIPVFVRLAEAYRREGLLEDAVHICREGLKAHPESAAARFVLAQVQRDRGDREEARKEFRKVLALDPADAAARRELVALESEGVEEVDPIASPTLAALMAFHGDAAAAEDLYRRLEGSELEPPVESHPEGGALAALLAFRDAARRLRSMNERAE